MCRVQTSRMLMKLLDLAHEALYLKKSTGRGPAPDPSGIYCEFSVSLVNIDLIQVLYLPNIHYLQLTISTDVQQRAPWLDNEAESKLHQLMNCEENSTGE